MAEMRHADRFARVAARLRARGFEVDEQSGWRSRGSRGRSLVAVEGVMMHHTVDNPPADYPSLRVVRDGRSDLPGPLAQFGVGRSGRILLIAAGLANHAGRTVHGWQQNSRCVGIESAHMGTSREEWTTASMAAQRALVEELGREFGFGSSRVVGHKEAAVPRGRKVDPAYDMDAFRRSLSDKPIIPAVPLPVSPSLEELVQMNLTDRLPSANPDSKDKSITVQEWMQDVQANSFYAARNTAGLAALDRDLRGQLSGLKSLDKDLRADLKSKGVDIDVLVRAAERTEEAK